MWVRCVGQFPLLQVRRSSLVLRPSSLWMGFAPMSEASLRALSLQVCFLVVLAEAESLWLSLALSSVLPCVALWCSGSELASHARGPGFNSGAG